MYVSPESREYGSRSRSQEQKSRKSLFPKCITSITHNSGSIKDSDAMMHAMVCIHHGIFGNGGSNGGTAIFVT